MKKIYRVCRITAGLGLAVAVMTALGGVLVPPADADDTDLFRVGFAKPYLFIFFDTSSSVNTSPPDQISVPANGDDPDSVFFQMKKVFYEVFSQLPDEVHYAFSNYNQDELRVRGKHWLYQVAPESPAVSFGMNGPTYPDEGELLVFGAHFPAGTVGREPDFSGGGNEGPEQGATNGLVTNDPATGPPTGGVLGDCANPADLVDHRTHINRFSKLHPLPPAPPSTDLTVGSMLPTTQYIRAGGTVYKLVVSPVGGSLVGETPLTATFALFDCADNPIGAPADVQLTKVQEFLYHEQIDDDEFNLKSGNSHEMTNGYWQYRDVLAGPDAAGATGAACGDVKGPHTGHGWESNYDGDFVVPDVNPITGAPDLDSFADPCPTGDCNLLYPTDVYDNPPMCFQPPDAPEWRTRDQGDLIAFDWNQTNREAFFRRLAPNWSSGTPIGNLRFDVASYFTDVPATDGFLRLKNPGQRPLTAYGASSIGDALTDFRCWYAGTDGGNKCKQEDQPYGTGWKELAAACDADLGCSKIYQIIITDGENNCEGSNPASATANLKAKHTIESWVINFGGPQSRDLESLAKNTKGEYLEVGSGDELRDELERIAGIILEDVRQFASAAAPRVQTDDLDKVFTGSFQPVNDLGDITPAAGVWPGRVNAFLKPVPLNTDGTPDTSPAAACNSNPQLPPRANCHLWDAAEEMVAQNGGLGTGEAQRRVYYSQLGPVSPGVGRELLDPGLLSGGSAASYDLLRGMGLIPPTTPDGGDPDEATHETQASDALTRLYEVKSFDPGTPGDNSDDVSFVMGDVFHSEPLVVDQPEGVGYFRNNLFADPDPLVTCDSATPNPGYRCFFLKHQHRRKVMFFGANDGLLHAIDGGIYHPDDPVTPPGSPVGFEDRYDDGTGREIFAYAPRPVLPTIYSQNTAGGAREWSVDGSPTASDVFIDVGGPNGREWRTVLATGLRRGGHGYVAIDITQPDTYDVVDGSPEPGAGDYVPSCIGDTPPADCGPIPYATPLWEFTDSAFIPAPADNSAPDRLVSFDEDPSGSPGHGIPDLATTWSDPVLGLMHVCPAGGSICNPDDDNTDVEVRSVAVFGGGFNADTTAGDWLYIVDVETGQAIYKQRLCTGGTSGASCVSAGSAPAEPAVVDIDTDGFIDRVYLGTRGGYMLRADLVDADGNAPALEQVATVATVEAGVAATNVPRIIDPDFAPYEIFRAANPDNGETVPPSSRQIFYRAAAGFLSDLGQYAVAFGVGDRENLFTEDGAPGRFYVFRDDIPVGNPSNELYDESDLAVVTDGVTGVLGVDTLAETASGKGWVLLTRSDDRLISPPTQIAGITVFTMFDPIICIDQDADGECDGGGGNGNEPETGACSRTGTSRVFAVNTRTSDGLLFAGGTRTRGIDIAGFVVSPSLERAGTQNLVNPSDPSSGSTRDEDPDNPQNLVACEDDADCMLAMAEMQKLQPDNCKYTSQRYNLSLTTDELVKVDEIPIPICIIDKNWVEL